MKVGSGISNTLASYRVISSDDISSINPEEDSDNKKYREQELAVIPRRLNPRKKIKTPKFENPWCTKKPLATL